MSPIYKIIGILAYLQKQSIPPRRIQVNAQLCLIWHHIVPFL